MSTPHPNTRRDASQPAHKHLGHLEPPFGPPPPHNRICWRDNLLACVAFVLVGIFYLAGRAAGYGKDWLDD